MSVCMRECWEEGHRRQEGVGRVGKKEEGRETALSEERGEGNNSTDRPGKKERQVCTEDGREADGRQ